MNIFHLYCNYFDVVVFLQIVNLEELVFDKNFLIFYAMFLVCLFDHLPFQNLLYFVYRFMKYKNFFLNHLKNLLDFLRKKGHLLPFQLIF